MDDAHFDAITRRLAAPRSRRGALSALLAGVGGIALLGRTAAAPLRTCSGSNFECPGKQLCGRDDATQQLVCKAVTGFDHSEFRVCKGEFEFTYCQRTSQCCVYPGIRDPGGLQLVANCCDDGLVCDTERGCVPRPGTG
jgi:hypothetical protein